jgi:hypothetical protein
MRYRLVEPACTRVLSVERVNELRTANRAFFFGRQAGSTFAFSRNRFPGS